MRNRLIEGRGAARELRFTRRANLTGLAFGAPFVIGFAALGLYPVLATLYYSFTEFNIFQSPTWIGFANYVNLTRDGKFWLSLGNTLYMTAIGVPLTIALALGGALLLNLPVRGQPLFRALVYVPVLVPVVVGAYLFRWLMNSQYGFLNYFLEMIGIQGPNWLNSADWGKPAIVLFCLWGIGGTMIIYLAALKDVPAELYEAARIDGAGPLRRLISITLPVLAPVTLFQVIVSAIAYLQIFTQPYIMAQSQAVLSTPSGGVGNNMLSYAMYLFQNAFSYLRMGYASAMAWILMLITAALSGVIFLMFRRWGNVDR